MSSPESSGGADPFSGGPLGDLMRNLARLFTSQGPINLEIARQMAVWAATGGQVEDNPDPVSRVRLEELVRVAEMHVVEATGLDVVPGGALAVEAVSRGEWALRTFDDWRPFLERLAGRMSLVADDTEASSSLSSLSEGPGGSEDPMAKLFSNLPQVIGPFLFGLQAGSMVGQLGAQALGQYDLPMPRPARTSVMVVASSIDAFASDWSLDPDDVRMWVCLHEAVHHAVLGRSHVRTRIEELITSYVESFSATGGTLETKLAGLDPTDMAAMQEAFGDPEALLGEIQNDAQRQIQVPLRALLATVEGYCDHIMDTVGRRLVSSYGPLTEALHRRRLEETPGTRILGQLLGVSLDAVGYEQGQAFVRGVLERAGTGGLDRLWRSERELPTPAELDAPGLWLARIDLPA